MSIVPFEQQDGLAHLPAIEKAVEQVRLLVSLGAAADLDEARRQAEALALYEKRAANKEREHHYWTLRILCEAGLGVLSYDDSSIIENTSMRSECRVLAAAFERGKLTEICKKEEPSTGRSSIYCRIRDLGYTHVAGDEIDPDSERESVRWFDARLIAIERGIDLESLQPDTEYVKRLHKKWKEQGKRKARAYLVAQRYAQMKRQKDIASAAKEVKETSPSLSVAYGLLRRTMQAMHDAYNEAPRRERDDLDSIFWHLHQVEDHIGDYLRVPD